MKKKIITVLDLCNGRTLSPGMVNPKVIIQDINDGVAISVVDSAGEEQLIHLWLDTKIKFSNVQMHG